MTQFHEHATTAAEQRLIAQADAQLDRLAAIHCRDTDEFEGVAQERGAVQTVRHMAKHGCLTHAGQVEAGKLLAASADWVREMTGEEAGHER